MSPAPITWWRWIQEDVWEVETWHGWGIGWTHPSFLHNLIPRLLPCPAEVWELGCSVCYMGVTMARLVDSGVGVAGGEKGYLSLITLLKRSFLS